MKLSKNPILPLPIFRRRCWSTCPSPPGCDPGKRKRKKTINILKFKVVSISLRRNFNKLGNFYLKTKYVCFSREFTRHGNYISKTPISNSSCRKFGDSSLKSFSFLAVAAWLMVQMLLAIKYFATSSPPPATKME